MTGYVSDKRPFKGKGAIALDIDVINELSDWRDLVTAFRSINDAQARRSGLEIFRERLRAMATSMIASFNSSYPSARLRLCRSPDRSNTYLRWRLTLRDHNMARTELDSSEAMIIVAQLPADVARDWLRYEEYRIQLNYFMALAVYECQRTSHHIERLQALKQMRATDD